jgi:hypothetical protein
MAKNPRYIKKVDVFSFDSGNKIAHFSDDTTNGIDLQENVENFRHHNFLVSQNKYKIIQTEDPNNPSFVANYYVSHFQHLPDGNRFDFHTKPTLSYQGIVIPTVPHSYEGHFSPNGRYFVSVHSIPKPYNYYYNSQQPMKNEVEITTWQLPE